MLVLHYGDLLVVRRWGGVFLLWNVVGWVWGTAVFLLCVGVWGGWGPTNVFVFARSFGYWTSPGLGLPGPLGVFGEWGLT